MIRRPRQLVLALAACGLLSACGVGSYVEPLYSWALPGGEEDEAEEMAGGTGQLYCYQTLATPDCYDRPQPGAPNRLIGRKPVVVLP